MPSVFGKENKKKELISKLPEIYLQLQREYQISAGDFPEVKKMQVLCLKRENKSQSKPNYVKKKVSTRLRMGE